jgi:hypothetical protein
MCDVEANSAEQFCQLKICVKSRLEIACQCFVLDNDVQKKRRHQTGMWSDVEANSAEQFCQLKNLREIKTGDRLSMFRVG